MMESIKQWWEELTERTNSSNIPGSTSKWGVRQQLRVENDEDGPQVPVTAFVLNSRQNANVVRETLQSVKRKNLTGNGFE